MHVVLLPRVRHAASRQWLAPANHMARRGAIRAVLPFCGGAQMATMWRSILGAGLGERPGYHCSPSPLSLSPVFLFFFPLFPSFLPLLHVVALSPSSTSLALVFLEKLLQNIPTFILFIFTSKKGGPKKLFHYHLLQEASSTLLLSVDFSVAFWYKNFPGLISWSF